MIMDIIELTAENADLYSELVDRNAAENLGRRGFFGIAAVENGQPLSAMIWHIINSTQGIILHRRSYGWMCMMPLPRRNFLILTADA